MYGLGLRVDRLRFVWEARPLTQQTISRRKPTTDTLLDRGRVLQQRPAHREIFVLVYREPPKISERSIWPLQQWGLVFTSQKIIC